MVDIVRQLNGRFGLDFSKYRPSTISRRVGRRMMNHSLTDTKEYSALLERDPREQEALFHDLLISVTEFFRDPESFCFLNDEVIPKLLEEKGSGPVRVWSAGCATGEEAYSLAILLKEAAGRVGFDGDISIFATDVRGCSLEKASKGTYDGDHLKNIAPERLERWFKQNGRSYRISDELREAVVFAPQNLIADLPLFKMDLVSCRNVLIYLKPEVQARVISSLHLGMTERGYLFLGSSEGIGQHCKGLEMRNSRHKVFRKSAPEGELDIDGRICPNKTFLANDGMDALRHATS
ncbi:MAG: chemotaxis methyltransferase CheR [Methanomassiliicoccales archaeon PtaU1.Bin124]|nr:MAG: chemotaxis methyltransferase CheR [Methanomassiliicoccales archaeon PtaU1.Bin124]